MSDIDAHPNAGSLTSTNNKRELVLSHRGSPDDAVKRHRTESFSCTDSAGRDGDSSESEESESIGNFSEDEHGLRVEHIDAEECAFLYQASIIFITGITTR